ncbi:MAG TPA: SDR family oxidoreductase [Candidatus Acidoferrales bacterium]|nr:SDR family oxidoreductase [Candidatus Acidoferrales bacterium]
MARLLITGATGLLGSNLIREAAESYEVIGWSRSCVDMPPGCAMDRVDLANADITTRCLHARRPDVIVHCAAMTDVEMCEREPDVARVMNVEATRILAQWCAQHGARFVFISTDSVFDGRCGRYGEDDQPAPLNEYARTKLAAETVVTGYLPDALILRTNFYGRNFKQKLSLAEWMLKKLARREPFLAFADVRFNPLLANHLGRIILDLIANGAKGVFHAAARDECSKYEFALLIARIFGLHADQVMAAPVDDFEFTAQRPKNTTLAVDKISGFLVREMPSVEEGLQSFQQSLGTDCADYLATLGSGSKEPEALSAR